jgi:hypothetical protein
MGDGSPRLKGKFITKKIAKKVIDAALLLLVESRSLAKFTPFSQRVGALKFMRVALGLILFASIPFIGSIGLFAQTPSPSPTPEPMEAKITFRPGDEVTVESKEGGSDQKIVPTVGLLPNQQVTVTLEFSNDRWERRC